MSAMNHFRRTACVVVLVMLCMSASALSPFATGAAAASSSAWPRGMTIVALISMLGYFAYQLDAVTIGPFDNGSDRLPNPTDLGIPALQPGELVRGELTLDDEQLPDGTLADLYALRASEGEYADIRMEATFDAYLFVIDPNGDILAQDDDSGGGTDARLAITLPEAGTYVVVANSYAAGLLGSYTLEVELADEAPISRAAESEPTPDLWFNAVIDGELQPDAPMRASLGGQGDFRTYTFIVPKEVSAVRLELNAVNDLDLFVRHGDHMREWADDPDFVSLGPGGRESISIGPATDPPLHPGTYYVDVANLLKDPGGSFTLTLHFVDEDSAP